MSDYTVIGIEKIARQARVDPSLIRCPRDSAVMRTTRCLATRGDRTDGEVVSADRLPTGRGWIVTQVDVQCPACGRCALEVEVRPVPSPSAAIAKRRPGSPYAGSRGIPA